MNSQIRGSWVLDREVLAELALALYISDKKSTTKNGFTLYPVNKLRMKVTSHRFAKVSSYPHRIKDTDHLLEKFWRMTQLKTAQICQLISKSAK